MYDAVIPSSPRACSLLPRSFVRFPPWLLVRSLKDLGARLIFDSFHLWSDYSLQPSFQRQTHQIDTLPLSFSLLLSRLLVSFSRPRSRPPFSQVSTLGHKGTPTTNNNGARFRRYRYPHLGRSAITPLSYRPPCSARRVDLDRDEKGGRTEWSWEQGEEECRERASSSSSA